MKKRIFAAIDVSDEARQKVRNYIEHLRRQFPDARVGWEKPEKLHLTMKFVGEIEDERLTAFSSAVQTAARQVSSFEMRISGAGVFPSPRNARVLWLGLEDETSSLRAVHEVLERECEKEGFIRERRSFKPHLTIGRIKIKPDESLIRQHLNGDFEPPAPFVVPEIAVYQSELSPAGSKYSVVLKAAFNGHAEK